MILAKFLAASSSIIVVLLAFNIATKSLPYTSNNIISANESLEVLPIEGAFGPESLAFDPAGGGPYAGVSDGRILKWLPDQRRWADFAFTSPNREACEKQHDHEKLEHICGRPLGLQFNEKTGDLYIADAHLGLLVVGPNGGLATRVVTEANGLPLGFTNGLDIDQRNGLVYFTSSSTSFPRKMHMSIVLSNDKTGRLLKYDPQTKQVKVLVDNITYPNGVALSNNGESLLLVETTNCRILRYSLVENSTKQEGGTMEVLKELQGYPDNIKRNSKGEYWIGVYSKRGKVLKWLLSFPWIGNSVVNLPFNGIKLVSIFTRLKAIGLAVKLDANGNILKVLEDTSGKLKFVSEVVEKDGDLWFGSVVLPYASLYKGYNSHS